MYKQIVQITLSDFEIKKNVNNNITKQVAT